MIVGAPEEKDVLSNADILALFKQDPLLTHDEEGRPVRYRFAVQQPVAPWLKGAAPTFCTVQCHDLSVTDVRYFVDEVPVEDGIVIGLGLPSPVRWLVAEIVDYRSAYMYGRVGHLITARFVATIENPHRADTSSPLPAVSCETELLTTEN